MISENFQVLREKAQKELKEAQSLEELERVFKAYLGKNGELTQILRQLAALAPAARKEQGKEANDLRNFLEQSSEKRSRDLQSLKAEEQEKKERIDITAPGKRFLKGHLHPLTQVQRKAQEIFQAMGFAVVQGPEVETEWYNFDALNIPENHPARDMWDTFWLKQSENTKYKIRDTRYLLRTHTSPVQIRYMETHEPPLRIIAPGRVYRYEATDARHEFDLMQLEGLVVGHAISIANFKATIQEFYSQLFKNEMEVRLRPSFFPFVEPGFEVDMRPPGDGSDWMEMMGAGMVHPKVFENAGYKPRKWQGFAFGMGLERLAMMLYKINDIRLFRLGDMRFLRQF